MTRVQLCFTLFFCLLGALIVTDKTSASSEGLNRLLPEKMTGWKAWPPDREYTFDTLFNLIDGGAEVYRSLNVQKVLDRTYRNAGAADIIVDLFDMGSSKDAFGAFHHDIRENTDVNIGQESEYQGGTLFFWKDRYFVSIVALEETTQIKEVVLALGKTIALKITRPGSKPDIVKLLPSKGLQREQIFYFHDWKSLERRYIICQGNPLHLSKETEGLLARYHVKSFTAENFEFGLALFLIVAYPHRSDLLAAQQDFSNLYLNSAGPDEIVQISNRFYAGFYSTGTHLFAVLEAPNRATAKGLLDSVSSKTR